MTRTPAQALAVIQASARNHVDIGVGMCQKNAHEVYGIGPGAASALLAWEAARFKHTDLSTAPEGAFVFMDGGHTLVDGKPAGHVVIWAGNGKVWTPGGPKDQDHWYLTTLAEITQGWPWHHYVGWTEDINGVRVPGLAPRTATVKPTPTPNIDTAFVATRRSVRANKGPKKRVMRRSLRRALTILKRWSSKY